MKENIKVIVFDADDTLWINEPFFTEAEDQFCTLMKDYLPRQDAHRLLYAREIGNLPLYGYGIKAFMLSMLETAIEISGGAVTAESIDKIMTIGRTMLAKPVDLIDGVEEVLQSLKAKYRLIIATKGDLIDQERKLQKSRIAHYFEHVEILSEKNVASYERLMDIINAQPHELLMIGNSLKSDILPILELGGYGWHVPFKTTWEHERVDKKIEHTKFRELTSIREVLDYL